MENEDNLNACCFQRADGQIKCQDACWSLFERPFPWTIGTRMLSSILYAAAAAKLLQSCPTLCDPIDGSPPGAAVPGIL